MEQLLDVGDYSGAYKLAVDNSYGYVANKRAGLVSIIGKHPEFSEKSSELLLVEIGQCKTPSDVIQASKKVRYGESIGLFSPEQVAGLVSSVAEAAQSGNSEGRITFLLTDDVSGLPSLLTPDQRKFIFQRSLKALSDQETPPEPLAKAVMEEARKSGVGSATYEAVKAQLPYMNLRRSTIAGIVAEVFPEFSAEIIANATVSVFVEGTSESRLLAIDVAEILPKHSPAIKVVTEEAQANLSIQLEQIGYDERQDPERTQVVTVSYYAVDFGAALMMPQGANYLLDVTSGAATIDFAINIVAKKGGTIVQERLLRDKVRREYAFCSNPRVQNVFGGMQQVNFWATAEMQTDCARSTKPVNATDLRSTVVAKVADAIAAMDEIKAAEATLK